MIEPWTPYQYSSSLPSKDRTTLIAAFGDLVQGYTGFAPAELPDIFAAPDDDGENNAARHLVELDAEMLLRRFVTGKITTFARPMNGGEIQDIPSDLWEIDDPLPRFPTGCLNLEHWADSEAPVTHRIFLDSEQFDAWLAALKPAGFLTAAQIAEIGNPRLRAARVTASRNVERTGEQPLSAPNVPEIPRRTGVGPELLKLAEVEAMVSLSKSSIHQKIKDGQFPQQIKLGSASRWYRSEVEQYIAEQAALRGN